jgi:site-specific recombinase XerC
VKRQGIKYFISEQKAKFLKILKLRCDAVRSYMMYDLMLNTGLRLDEMVRLNVGDIQGRIILEVVGKGSKIRELPLNKAIREHLEDFLRWKVHKGEAVLSESPLFVSRKGNRISKRAVQRDFGKWIKEAGIEGHFTPHALRHTVGTELLNKTGNLRLVQTFLGHADVSTTMIYTHISREQIQQASELLAV